MKPTKMLRCASALQIAVAALLVCHPPSYAQHLDPRTALGEAARAVAVSNPMVAATMALSQAQDTFITFDVPGATGTDPVSINPAGEILGYSFDSTGAMSGFLRDRNGSFNTFKVPGATFYTAAFFGEGPPGSSLNPAGKATGGYADANFTLHGFARDGRGAITTFDAPGADTMPGDFNGTIPLSINAAGEVTGYYFDANFFGHGFFRDSHGTVTVFDAPDASTGCSFGLTYPNAINAGGAIVGNYYDAQCGSHGFLRERNGTVTVLESPSFIGTNPLSINDGGEIAGFGFDTTGAAHWFVIDYRGAFITFDTSDVRDFVSMDINPAGVIVGSYLDTNLVFHSFRRAPDGTLTAIDVPGAGTGTLQGTNATSINPTGVITGSYTDANGVSHGFLFQPQ